MTITHIRILGLFLFLSAHAFANITLLEKDDWKFQFGGFAELDMMRDSTRSLLEIPGSTPIARPGTLSGEDGRTQFSARNSRLIFLVIAPTQNEWRARGFIEGDFLGAANGAQEGGIFSNPTFRLRHAFLSAERNGFQILAGQFWSLFGWQMQYILPTVSVPPVTGVLFSRTPQLMVMKTFGALQAAAALNRPAQRDSRLPDADFGVRYAFEGWKGGYTGNPTGDEGVAPMSFALTGTVRDFETPAGNGNASAMNHQTGYAAAIDGFIPIIPSSDGKDPGNSLILTGEATVGQGYGDQFPGFSGNLKQQVATENSFAATSVNLDAGLGGFEGGVFRLVKLSTFNVDLQYHFPSDWHTYVNVGYAALHSSNVASLTPTNGTPYFRSEVLFANVYHDFTKQVRVAFEWAYFKTKYSDGVEPHNHRLQVSAWFRI